VGVEESRQGGAQENVREAMQFGSASTIVGVLVGLGGRAPADTIEAACIAGGLTGDEEPGVASVHEVISLAVASGVVSSEVEDVTTPGLRGTAYLRLVGGQAPIEPWMGLSADARTRVLHALGKHLIGREADGRLNPNVDAGWAASLVGALHSLQQYQLAVDVSQVLLRVDGDLRAAGPSTDMRRLAEAAFKSAREIDSTDIAIYFGLVLGENYYSLGRLVEAAEVFSGLLDLNPSPDRRLQVLRSLGQVSYRRRQYADALVYYTDALRLRAHAPDSFVASVLHNRAKALFRLAHYQEASDDIKHEIDFRTKLSEPQPRALLKAEHELARIAQAQGNLEEAQRAYSLVLAGAEAEHFDRFIPAPLYQLMLVRMEQGDLEQAAELASRLADAALKTGDALWLALSGLADAMVLFERSEAVEAAKSAANAIRIARDVGLDQVIADAQAWARRLLDREIQSSEDGGRGKDVVEVVGAVYPGLSSSKARKAALYSRQPGRVHALHVEFRSDHGVRILQWQGSRWCCDCDYFKDKGICSHLAAVSLMDLAGWAPTLVSHRREPSEHIDCAKGSEATRD